TSERSDRPDHFPKGVLHDLLGIRAVAGDADRQPVGAISVQGDQRLDGPGLLPPQCFYQISIAIHSHWSVTERYLSHVNPLACGITLHLTAGCIAWPYPDRCQNRGKWRKSGEGC